MNALNVNRKLAVEDPAEVQSVPCSTCGWPSLSYQCFTECRDSRGRTKKSVPSLCGHVWRLHGERREVQCRLPYNHVAPFHLSGGQVTPV